MKTDKTRKTRVGFALAQPTAHSRSSPYTRVAPFITGFIWSYLEHLGYIFFLYQAIICL